MQELQPSGKIQGSYYILNLHSCQHIVRNKWAVSPVPAEVISTIHQLAVACNKSKRIAFTDKERNIINDTNDPYAETYESGPNYSKIEITRDDEDDMGMDLSGQTGHITGVEDDMETDASTQTGHITGVGTHNAAQTTGVQDNATTHHNYMENFKNMDAEPSEEFEMPMLMITGRITQTSLHTNEGYKHNTRDKN